MNGDLRALAAFEHFDQHWSVYRYFEQTFNANQPENWFNMYTYRTIANEDTNQNHRTKAIKIKFQVSHSPARMLFDVTMFAGSVDVCVLRTLVDAAFVRGSDRLKRKWYQSKSEAYDLFRFKYRHLLWIKQSMRAIRKQNVSMCMHVKRSAGWMDWLHFT